MRHKGGGARNRGGGNRGGGILVRPPPDEPSLAANTRRSVECLQEATTSSVHSEHCRSQGRTVSLSVSLLKIIITPLT